MFIFSFSDFFLCIFMRHTNITGLTVSLLLSMFVTCKFVKKKRRENRVSKIVYNCGPSNVNQWIFTTPCRYQNFQQLQSTVEYGLTVQNKYVRTVFRGYQEKSNCPNPTSTPATIQSNQALRFLIRALLL